MIIPRQRVPRAPRTRLRRRLRRRAARLPGALAALLVVAALSSCGQTGDLYLPDENKPSREQ